MRRRTTVLAWAGGVSLLVTALAAFAQLPDNNKAPNAENAGINKTLAEQVGAGRGDVFTRNSSIYILNRDPFRSIRRGRQLFQRKWSLSEGVGPIEGDGSGDIENKLIVGAGLADSCAACHGRPRGSAGFGGDVVTRPDSRDAPHLFGLGLVEQLADEMTSDLRTIRAQAISSARLNGVNVTRNLVAKGISFGQITARPSGSVDNSRVEGVDSDLRIKPFFHHGESFSIREFVVGALNAEMGLESPDPDLFNASRGSRVQTPAGLVLDGDLDDIPPPPVSSRSQDGDGDGVVNEADAALVDHLEFYLLNYFKPALYRQDSTTAAGKNVFVQIGCSRCHVADLTISRDRRLADVETVFDSSRGIFNRLFATATPLMVERPFGTGHPPLKQPALGPFTVRNFFSDLKRHDLGPKFWERNFDGTLRKQFVTEPLWGVGSTGPYGHDGRSINLNEVILRHGGAAQLERDRYAAGISSDSRAALLTFLESLVLFPPDDTASNLDPGNPSDPSFPQRGHGSIRLTGLFLDPTDPE
jgi:hypothetical protein